MYFRGACIKIKAKIKEIDKRERISCERAQALETFWPESHQNNPKQQVSHTSFFVFQK